MKYGKNLKLGDARVTPRNIQEFKRQSLVMPKASPLHHQNTRSSFTMLYFYCFICYVLFLERFRFLFSFFISFIFFYFVFCNKWVDPIIFVLEKPYSVSIA